MKKIVIGSINIKIA